MQWKRVKNRGHQLTLNTCGWDFNIYVILGDKYNYVIDTGLGDQTDIRQ